MSHFKWTIEYTLSLTLPVFMYLLHNLTHLRTDHAIDSFFSAYAAAKYGKESFERFMQKAGSFTVNEEVRLYIPTSEDFDRAKAQAADAIRKLHPDAEIKSLQYDEKVIL